MDKPFFLIGNYSVTRNNLGRVVNLGFPEYNDEPELVYGNYKTVELSSVYATADKKYVIHCTQEILPELDDDIYPIDDNSDAINRLNCYRLEKIFEQYNFCTVIVNQPYDVLADIAIIPNEAITTSDELFDFMSMKPSYLSTYAHCIYDKNKETFVKIEEPNPWMTDYKILKKLLTK